MPLPYPAASQAVLFLLQGVRERQIFLAPVSAARWCETVRPGFHRLPAEVVSDLAPYRADESFKHDDDGTVDITPGSSENDAALFLATLCRSFPTVQNALAHAHANGLKVDENEYTGYIY